MILLLPVVAVAAALYALYFALGAAFEIGDWLNKQPQT